MRTSTAFLMTLCLAAAQSLSAGADQEAVPLDRMAIRFYAIERNAIHRVPELLRALSAAPDANGAVRVDAERLLREAEADFVPGSTATLYTGSRKLVVLTTPENLRLVEAALARERGTDEIFGRLPLKRPPPAGGQRIEIAGQFTALGAPARVFGSPVTSVLPGNTAVMRVRDEETGEVIVAELTPTPTPGGKIRADGSFYVVGASTATGGRQRATVAKMTFNTLVADSEGFSATLSLPRGGSGPPREVGMALVFRASDGHDGIGIQPEQKANE